MLDGNTQIIDWVSSLYDIGDIAVDVNVNIVGRDGHGDFYPTKILAKISNAGETNWRQIIANSVTLICTPDTQLWTSTGWKLASVITTSDSIYGLSGTDRFSFTAGGYTTHVAVANQYNAIFTSFAVTTSSSYSQTATSYGLKCSTGRYLANRFLVRGE